MYASARVMMCSRPVGLGAKRVRMAMGGSSYGPCADLRHPKAGQEAESCSKWGAVQRLNLRPLPCESSVLPLS